ncbi:oxidoreductase [Pseudolabrys taiwanensis]|uniref:Oxidoreductase n=1 Tax=Pseudolabrys taiwanensis TaxID=331696 RepID=A0A346A4U0_9HYPH|nr:PDR/VanB family oxidoreductase [Pseudolabrys taiwanensis]AXK84187.1 oxidoreductase [Pseudolabrys taiwanensis]
MSLEQSTSTLGHAAQSGLIEVVVVRRAVVADGVVLLDLHRRDSGHLPVFAAGAHIDLHLTGGLVRQYSLCGDPADPACYRLAIKLEASSRGGSAAVWAVAEGERLFIGAPRNNFRLAEGAGPFVLVAGGIGVTPLLAMAHELERRKADYHLHYCVRNADGAKGLAALGAAPLMGRISVHADDDPKTRLDLASVLQPRGHEARLYLCGPAAFMDLVVGRALAAGWPSDNIHLERFAATVDQAGDAFTVTAQRSGVTVTVGPGVSIAEALTRAGVAVPLSCEQGVCGTCLLDVIEGIPDHRDSFLTDNEKAANAQLAACCSRAKTARLVLDI